MIILQLTSREKLFRMPRIRSKYSSSSGSSPETKTVSAVFGVDADVSDIGRRPSVAERRSW